MFDFIKKLFGFGKKEEEPVMKENKMEFKPLVPDKNEEPVVPATRYTEEYAEFNERELNERAQEAEMSLGERMMADPFADVAAQDEDVEIPEVKEETPEEEPAEERDIPTEEEMLKDPFADVAAQDEDVEIPEVKEEAPEEEPAEERDIPTEEEMLKHPFADVAAQDEDPE